MFAHILMNYDLKPFEERPQATWIGGNYVPPVQAAMQIRRKRGTATGLDRT